MENMEINYFKEFVVLAETRNYWEASERLFLNQSTLSKHIKNLEQELGVELFARTTRKVELTEYGTALLPYAQTIANAQFDYSATLLNLKDQNKNILTIGSIPVIAQYNITSIFIDFRKRYPEYHYRICEDDTKELLQLLLRKKCELVFLRETNITLSQNTFEKHEIVRIPYMQDHLIAVLPNDHPLAGRQEITLRELQGEDFCFIKDGSFMYDVCRSACHEAGIIPNIVYDSHRLDNIFDMVTRGKCVALMMNKHGAHPIESDMSENPPFSTVKITPTIMSQISLCYLKKAPLSRAARQFIDYFQNYIDESHDS